MLLKFAKHDEGSTSAMLSIMFPLFIGATLLATEVGYWQMHTSELQNTADMAAFAGAYEYIIDGDLRDSGLAAYADALDNEFDPQMGTLNINVPPLSGAFAGDPEALEVVIIQDYPSMISSIFGAKPITKTVTATAVFGGQDQHSCVLALAPNGTSISVGGNVDVNLSGCGIHSNSTSSSAISTWGSVTVTAACMSAVGGISTGTADINLEDCAAPRENVPEIENPFSYLTMPANAGTAPCQYSSSTGSGRSRTTTIPAPATASDIVRICDSSISLSGIMTLQPGIYVFDSTDISFGSHAELHGTGVTLIFRNNASIGSMNGNNALNLSAPTTGDYSGIVMMTDEATTSETSWNMGGNADVSLEGTAYLPNISLQYAGGAGTSATGCTQLIADRVSFTGNSGFQSNCEAYESPVILGGAYTTVALAE